MKPKKSPIYWNCFDDLLVRVYNLIEIKNLNIATVGFPQYLVNK